MNPLDTLSGLDPGIPLPTTVAIGAICGLLVFAVASAAQVVSQRRRGRRPDPKRRRVERLVGAVVWVGAFVFIFAALRLFSSQELFDGRGTLVGDDLHTVMPRPGFLPVYPNLRDAVKAGEAILLLRRDAGPDEIEAARRRRQILREELSAIRSSSLEVDPTLLRDYSRIEGDVREVEERKQQILDSLDSLVREAPKQELENESRRRSVRKEMQAVGHEIEQNRASLAAAAEVLQSAQNLEREGLVSTEELTKKRERVEVLSSREAELLGRQALLTEEADRLRVLSSRSDGAYSSQLALRRKSSVEAEEQLERLRLELARAEQRLIEDRKRAESQRANRERQVEIQIAELDTLIDDPASALTVTAPWDGRVGFREPSPASAKTSDRPLLVLHQPGKVWVRLHVLRERLDSLDADRASVDLLALTPETVNAPFKGRIDRVEPLDDDILELRISCEPPPFALREIARGNTFPVKVAVRQPTLLAPVTGSWPLMGGLAVLLGVGASELNLRRRARRRDVARGEARGAPERRWQSQSEGRLQQFTEYVPGLGKVERPLSTSGDGEAEPRRIAEIVSIESGLRAARPVVSPPDRSHLDDETSTGDRRSEAEPAAPAPSSAGKVSSPVRGSRTVVRFDEGRHQAMQQLGRTLRAAIVDRGVTPQLLGEVEAIAVSSDLQAIAALGMGMGPPLGSAAIANAGCVLFEQVLAEETAAQSLRSAVLESARYLRVLRRLGGGELDAALDGLRAGLLAAGRAAASNGAGNGPELEETWEALRRA